MLIRPISKNRVVVTIVVVVVLLHAKPVCVLRQVQ
jgi:hypothetical protein